MRISFLRKSFELALCFEFFIGSTSTGCKYKTDWYESHIYGMHRWEMTAEDLLNMLNTNLELKCNFILSEPLLLISTLLPPPKTGRHVLYLVQLVGWGYISMYLSSVQLCISAEYSQFFFTILVDYIGLTQITGAYYVVFTSSLCVAEFFSYPVNVDMSDY